MEFSERSGAVEKHQQRNNGGDQQAENNHQQAEQTVLFAKFEAHAFAREGQSLNNWSQSVRPAGDANQPHEDFVRTKNDDFEFSSAAGTYGRPHSEGRKRDSERQLYFHGRREGVEDSLEEKFRRLGQQPGHQRLATEVPERTETNSQAGLEFSV